MPENKFNWNFDEAETNERLIALKTTDLTLRELIMERHVVTGQRPEELTNVRSIVGDMNMSLLSYGTDKGYNLFPYFDAVDEIKMKEAQNPFKQEYDQIMEDSRKKVDEYLKSKNVEIDESQFEVLDQNQRTL